MSAADSPGILRYPAAPRGTAADVLHGVEVADPYRWLEDETSAETKAWIEDQNKVTFGYLDTIPYREKLKARLTELYNYPRISAPFRRGDTYFFTKNDGLQNQRKNRRKNLGGPMSDDWFIVLEMRLVVLL